MVFADGGTLRLFDKRRLGRVRLEPDVDALGPDAETITRDGVPDPGRPRARAGEGPAAGPVGAGRGGQPAGRRDPVAGPAQPDTPADELAGALDRLYDALQAALKSAIAQGGVHTGEVIPFRGADTPCPRCGAADAARHRRQPLDLVVLPRTGLTRPMAAGAGCDARTGTRTSSAVQRASQARADQPTGQHVAEPVHPEVDPGQPDRAGPHGDRRRPSPPGPPAAPWPGQHDQRAEHRDGHRRVPGRQRLVGRRHQPVDRRRSGPVEQPLDPGEQRGWPRPWCPPRTPRRPRGPAATATARPARPAPPWPPCCPPW